MNFDFNLSGASSLIEFIGFSDRVEHEGYFEELVCLNLSNENQARYAIEKWLIPEFERYYGRTAEGVERVRTGFQVAISRWGFLPSTPSLPGIDGAGEEAVRPLEIFELRRHFYFLVWKHLFRTSFEFLSNTDGLCERVDQNFVNAPNNPETWGVPKYRAINHWDELIESDAWRSNWPPGEKVFDFF